MSPDPSCQPERKARRFVCLSSGLRALRHLAGFLDATAILSPLQARLCSESVDAVLVWGRKSSSRRAIAYAAARDLPVWFLEDGWIRTAAADAHGRTTYSIVVDTEGVHYDAAQSCSLERLLNLDAVSFDRLIDRDLLARAKRCRSRIVEHEITKYNYCHEPDHSGDDCRPLVLLIDQTRDDESVRFGGMREADFQHMLEAALDENPGARVVLRTHPDVVSGRRTGYLDSRACRFGVEVHAVADNPLSWLKRASRAYVGTSQLGYEALLCGCPVSVFGQPFYAGWGLTDDRKPVARRRQKRSVDELFAATHILYARYCHPVSGKHWSLEACIDHVILQKRMYRINARRHVCIGIAPWKRGFIKQYLRSPGGAVRFARCRTGVADSETVVTWSFRYRDPICDNGMHDGLSRAIERANPIRIEDGFLRSQGLGSNYVPPGSLVFDATGLYFDATRESDLERLLNERDVQESEIRRARSLRSMICDTGVSKYNLSGSQNQEFPRSADRHCVLVIGQVEGDQSLIRGSARIRTNRDLLAAVRRRCPDSLVVYRPHPDVLYGRRQGAVDAILQGGLADAIDGSATLDASLKACDELHTMTSQTGFEALLRGCRVVCHGAPFYAGWGLTEDCQPTPRRRRTRTLDELVYLSLIEYPRYLDIASGEFITAEDMVEKLARAPAKQLSATRAVAGTALTRLNNILRALRYAP